MSQLSNIQLKERIVYLEEQLEVHKAIEKNLFKGGQYLRTILETSPIGACIFRKSDLVIVFSNACCADLFGYSAAHELLGISIEKHWKSNQQIQEQISVLNKSDNIPSNEVSLVSRDDKPILGMVSLDRIELEDEESILCWIYDITNQKNAEGKILKLNKKLEKKIRKRTKKLFESNQINQELFDNADVSIWNEDISKIKNALNKLRDMGVTDLKTHLMKNPSLVQDLIKKIKVVNVNKATLKLFGADSKENLIRHIDKTFGPDAINIFIEELCAIWDKQPNFRKEVTFIALDGKTIDAIISFQVPLTDDGYKNIPISIVDITKQKEMEKVIRDSEESFRSLAENSQDYIMRYDRQCRHLYQNSAAYKISGFTEEEFVGKTHKELGFEKSLCDLWEKKILGVFNSGKSAFEIFDWESTEGKVYLDWRLYPEFNEKGEVVTVLAVSRDITEYKKLERELLQAQKTESLGILAGGIAHDFNNMLAVILGNAQLLSTKLQNGNKNDHRYLNEILAAGNRSAKLVKQILTFSRSDIVEKTALNMTEVVSEGLELLRATIPTNINIIKNFSAPGKMINGNKTQIHQIMMNLMTNSFHAMEDEGGTLEVILKDYYCEICSISECSIKSDQNTQSCLQLIISDTGIGIPSEYKDKIMDPFFTTKNVGDGTGLGLAMVNSITLEHDGIISIDSKVNKGTEVKICFPMISKISNEEDIGKPIELHNVETHTAHILLVDDEHSLTDMYQEYLTDSGYKVTSFTDSLEALECFNNNPEIFDLLLTDQSMPNLTGKQLSQEVRKLRNDLPIILATGYSKAIDEKQIDNIGISKYLMKPVDLTTLLQVIEDCLPPIQEE